MRPDERDAALLWDMLVHAREAAEFVRGRTLHEYLGDRLLRAGVERVVQIIGEAAFQMSAEFRDAHEEIPWVAIMNQRHIPVHRYGIIDNEKIWRVATVYAPALIPLIEPLLPSPPPDPAPEPDGS